VNSLVNELWIRFHKEILPELQPRDRWYKICGSLAIGDMVLIVDPKIPRGLWSMGRVIDVKSSRDNLVRTATVFSGERTLDYAIVQLIKLFTPGVENDPPSQDPLAEIDSLEKVVTNIPEGLPVQPMQPISQFQELKRKTEQHIYEQALARRAQEQLFIEETEVIQNARFCLSARQPIPAFEALKARSNTKQTLLNPNSEPLWCLKTIEGKLQADREVREAEQALREAEAPQDKLDAMCRLQEARRNPMRTKPTRLEPSVKQLKLDMDLERKARMAPTPLVSSHAESEDKPSDSSPQPHL
jgi:hypothetical protein